MTVLTDTFVADTGQLTTIIPVVTNNTPWKPGGGSFAIIGNQCVLSADAASGGSPITGLIAQENSWPISTPSITITTRLGVPTWVMPLPGIENAHFGSGIVKDAGNFMVVQGGPDQSTTALTMFVYMAIGGIVTVFSGNTSLVGGNLPDAIGFGLVNNDVTIYLSFAGVWELCTSFGSGGHVDVSAAYDFTAPGALTGWCPGMIWGQNSGSPPSSIACSQIQFAEPFIDPVTGGIAVPNVVGQSQADAEAAINAVNLVVGTVTGVSSDSPVGFVVSQSPAAGTMVAFDSPVNISVSEGVTLRSVYGKFAQANAFPPTLLIDAKGIKPRIYMPKENVTVQKP